MLHDFSTAYSERSDDELLLLASDRPSLTTEAATALDSELRRRNLTESDQVTHQQSDGAVFGFLFGQYRIAFPYIVDNYVSEGDDVVVLQVNPLRLLGVIKRDGVKYTRGLSIDHRNGKTTVLAYRQDHWERHDFPDVQP